MTTIEPTAKPRRRRLPSWALTLLAILALVVGAAWFVIGNQQEATRADSATTVATDQATTLDRLCATDPDVARRIPDDCAEAREIREEVILPAAAPGPSQAQVQDWVRDWLEAHPGQAGRDGKDATPEQVARAVAEHMAGNGQEQIAAVAQAYLAANAERFRGEDGQNGQDGADASDDQVATAVAAFCAERDSCRGVQGERGPEGRQGVGVVDAQPIRNGEGTCEWVVTLEDPATGERSEVRHPASDAACPLAPPPPEEPGGGLLPGG